MKKTNIIRTTSFILAMLLIMMALSQVCNALYVKNNHAVTGRFENLVGIQNEKKDMADVLIIGDSESYTSVSPSYLWNHAGISCYDVGESGQTVIEAYYTLQTALHTQKPKVVFIETNMLYRTAPRMHAFGAKFSEFFQAHFSILRYHNMWKNYFSNSNVPKLQFFKGFSIRSAILPYVKGDYMHKTKAEKPVPDVVKSYFHDIIQLCRDNHIEVVLYSSPSPKNYNYKKHNGIKKYARQLGVPYVDMNVKEKAVAIDWTKETLDAGDHLNVAGAQKTSAFILSYLQKKYSLPDHRGEARYRTWDKRAKEFQTQCDQNVAVIENSGGK